MIEVGSFVRYKASDDEAPVPALVQTVWEDGSGYELYVFHFTSQSHVRSAHPSQVEEVGSNKDQTTRIDELNEDLAALAARVTDLEEENAMIKAELNSRDNVTSSAPVQVDASELTEEVPAPAIVDSGVESTSEMSLMEQDETELVGAGTKGRGQGRKRSQWPSND